MSSVKYIVGERFYNFCNNHNQIYKINEFFEKIETNDIDKNNVYVVGQGVSKQEINKLSHLKIQDPDIRLKLCSQKEDKIFVHKHEESNVMITKPKKIDEKVYQSYLLIDDECAEMSDHMTGEHIQGMIIIEVARQMMLSVTENYFVKSDHHNNISVLLENVTSNFLSFLFPVAVDISFKIESTKSTKFRTKYRASVLFYQGVKEAANIKIEYSVYDKAWLALKEAELAKQVLSLESVVD